MQKKKRCISCPLLTFKYERTVELLCKDTLEPNTNSYLILVLNISCMRPPHSLCRRVPL